MKTIVFSKMLKEKSVDELIDLAVGCGFDGYDLCVRPEYVVNPDNVAEELPKAVNKVRQAGLEIPMVTGNFDLLTPEHPTVNPILAAMDRSEVRLIKLGYFTFDPLKQDYWQEVDAIRRTFEAWQELSRKYHVKICYHTHSHRCMGLNCAALAHLIRGFDPECIGAYIDPGHMLIEGEEISVGIGMVKEYLSILGLKDAAITRETKDGHGSTRRHFVPAGEGMVDWTSVFAELVRIGFSGPLSVHCEFEVPAQEFSATLKREVRFFNDLRDRAQGEAI